MSTELIKISDEAFGELINLPRIYDKNKLRVDTFDAAAAQYFTPWSNVKDITKLTFEEGEALLTPLRKLRSKGADLETSINTERGPHTRKLTQIASVLISLESTVKIRTTQIAGAENAWQTELKRRADVTATATANALAASNKEIADVNAIVQQINTNFGYKTQAAIIAMGGKFNQQTADTLQGYVNSLTAWSNKVVFAWDIVMPLTGTVEHIAKAQTQTLAVLTLEFPKQIKEAVQYLADLVPGRLIQLQEPAEQVVDVNTFASTVMETVNTMNAAAEVDATRQTLNAGFSAAAAPVQQSAGSKGKVEKKKYLVESKEGMQAIMQSWVTYSMPLLSMDELNTTLSFMRTAAAKRLNEGHPELISPGLKVVDDIQTRAARTPKSTSNA